jgi:hypothetical protein
MLIFSKIASVQYNYLKNKVSAILAQCASLEHQGFKSHLLILA